MNIKHFLLLIAFSILFFACSEDNDITTPRNLQEYVNTLSNKDFGEVIACAASSGTSLTYVFYYPEEGASDIRYYEADSLNVDQNDFSNYRRQELTVTDVFDGKLQRFSRDSETENWCLVTYMLDGVFHKSNPIRIKIETNPTGWTDEATIEYPEMLTPKFTWSDFGITDNAIYFQVISDAEEDTFVSGTYTYDNFFQFYDTSNVVLDINEGETPDDLVEDTEYLFTMMGVSEDNWVNLVIQKNFIPRNLEEYIEANEEKTIETATAFAASSSTSQSLSYIYYYPLTGATERRYYETESALVDENDFSNYRRVNLTEETVYGGKLRRYSRTEDAETWCIVTYVIDNVLYKSDPIKINNQSKPTEWLTEVDIEFTETLKPKFTWSDGIYSDNIQYFQLISDADNVFVSGTFTTEKTFQYYDTANVTETINLETPADLILNDEYKFTLMGLSNDNWVNLVIQESFIVE